MFGTSNKDGEDNQAANDNTFAATKMPGDSMNDGSLGDDNSSSQAVNPTSSMPSNPGLSQDLATSSSTTAPSLPGSSGGYDKASDKPTTDTPEPKEEKLQASLDESGDDLLNIKRGALQHLSPLVQHLDQSPEEKFRTTMMMIQASDDQSLVKQAYETAQKIEDDKARAQALLDVINEINYFTQQQGNK